MGRLPLNLPVLSEKTSAQAEVLRKIQINIHKSFNAGNLSLIRILPAANLIAVIQIVGIFRQPEGIIQFLQPQLGFGSENYPCILLTISLHLECIFCLLTLDFDFLDNQEHKHRE